MLALIGRGRRDQRSVQDMDNTDPKQASNANPWKEIERTVRTVDEEKVKDCTEDVDALLVFAGLYSAVLTAFLIESYKTLQYDPTQDYLRQIAAQTSGYTLSNGHLNATSSFQPPTFQAPEFAMRVNVCWFASLILSLSSASFGILVKQWLREFLAIPYINPQERMRIRGVRVQGLHDWKLFEIATLLPVLLQISLALFFVGLCFFTAAVHQSIGTTTVFLVCCWAFLFSVSVIAPLFSPRCPYKMTALKAAFRQTRPYIRSLLQGVPLQPFLRWLASAMSPAVIIVGRVSRRLCRGVLKCLPLRNVTHGPKSASPSGVPVPETVDSELVSEELSSLADDRLNLRILRHIVPSVFEDLASSSGNLYQDCTEDQDNEEDRGRILVQNLSPSLMQEGKVSLLGEEEDNLRSTVDNDLIIFRHIDSSFFDDNLLSLMQKALQLQPRPLHDTLNFVIMIFKSRLGSHPVSSPARSDLPQRVPWPWTLSSISRAALAGILADSMAYDLSCHRSHDWQELSATDSEWSTCLAFIILLAPNEISGAVPHLIRSLALYVDQTGQFWRPLDIFSYQMRTLAQYDYSWPLQSLFFLGQSLGLLGAVDAADCLAYVAHASFIDPDEYPSSGTYQRLLRLARSNTVIDDDDATILPSPRGVAILLEAARVILHKYTSEQTSSRGEFPWSIKDLLAFVLDALPIMQGTESEIDFRKPLAPSDQLGLYQVLTGLFTTSHTIHSLLNFFVQNPRYLLIPADSSYHDQSYPDLVGSLTCTREESMSIVSNCASFFSKLELADDFNCELLRVLYLIWRLIVQVDNEARAGWHRMFAAAASCFKIEANKYVPSCLTGHRDLCNVAFHLLNWFHKPNDDGHNEPSEADIEEATARSLIPNEMINVIRHCVCSVHAVDPETMKTFWRIKHLEDLDRTACRGGAQAGPSRETGDPESEPKPAAITGALSGSDVSTDNSEPLHVTTYSCPSESASVAGNRRDEHDTLSPRDPGLIVNGNDGPLLTSAHVHIADVLTMSSIDTGNRHGTENLSDRSNTPPPQPETVHRATEGEVKNKEVVRVPHANEDAPRDTSPIRLMTAGEEATAGSSVFVSTLLPQFPDREVDPSAAGDVSVALRAENLPQAQVGVFVRSFEREDHTHIDGEIRALSLPASYGRLDTASDTGEQDPGT